ncbi:unnamed protein product [Malus baccata var. baccata]
MSRQPSTATMAISKPSSQNNRNVVSEESENSDASPIKAGIADQNPKEEETDAYVSQSGGHCSNFKSSVCDTTPLSPKQEIETKIAEEASEHELESRGWQNV